MIAQETQSLSGYILGIVSLVFAFFIPLAAIVLAIISLVQCSKQKTPITKKGKIMSILAIIIGLIVMAVSIYLSFNQSGALTNFPSF